MNLRHLLRMSKWARNPPSEKQVIMVVVILLLCFALFGLEYMGWWPDWAEREPLKFRP
ncbi:hypothetical protein [Ruegeria sp.]|uniref:hypothetical protein n=1 Tax=Ruegeria sp. TaxID=1879320 RepID=UPI003C7AB981